MTTENMTETCPRNILEMNSDYQEFSRWGCWTRGDTDQQCGLRTLFLDPFQSQPKLNDVLLVFLVNIEDTF